MASERINGSHQHAVGSSQGNVNEAPAFRAKAQVRPKDEFHKSSFERPNAQKASNASPKPDAYGVRGNHPPPIPKGVASPPKFVSKGTAQPAAAQSTPTAPPAKAKTAATPSQSSSSPLRPATIAVSDFANRAAAELSRYSKRASESLASASALLSKSVGTWSKKASAKASSTFQKAVAASKKYLQDRAQGTKKAFAFEPLFPKQAEQSIAPPRVVPNYVGAQSPQKLQKLKMEYVNLGRLVSEQKREFGALYGKIPPSYAALLTSGNPANTYQYVQAHNQARQEQSNDVRLGVLKQFFTNPSKLNSDYHQLQRTMLGAQRASSQPAAKNERGNGRGTAAHALSPAEMEHNEMRLQAMRDILEGE
jgi:hypothetical protein